MTKHNLIKVPLLLLVSFGLLFDGGLKAAAKGKSDKGKKSASRSIESVLHERFVKVKRAYRMGEINRRRMWQELDQLHERGKSLNPEDRVALLQAQATMLTEAGLPIVGAIYAAQAVKIAPKPASREMVPSWSILKRVSEARPIQNLLDTVADKVDLLGRPAPEFGSDWNYFAANAAFRHGDPLLALKLYDKIRTSDRHFLPGRYQKAMLLVEQEKIPQAEQALRTMLQPMIRRYSPLKDETKQQLDDYAYLALGRLYYERERFPDSVKAYRAVSRESNNFYDALFEQAWAMFMAGYPPHALGALHGVESPFFEDVFNPEAPVLRALVHYWMCRYEESRNALADFSERYANGVEKLEDFLDRQRLEPETAYQMFENLVSGVSAASLGVPTDILRTAAEKDTMMLAREQYAALFEERRRLVNKGIFGRQTGTAKPLEYLDAWTTALRTEIGQKFLAELTDMKREYERLFAQAEFLYVELLMSEKDQILGKELHASSKITRVSSKTKIAGWADKTQSWRDGRGNEYWWDEVGYYIIPVKPQCNIQR